MRLDALCTPAAFGLTAAGWSREQIERTIEWLITLLDGHDEARRVRAEDLLMHDAVEMQNPPLLSPVA